MKLSLIHEDYTLNKEEEFHYLRASLEEIVVQVIYSFSQKYAVAWEGL